MSKPDPRLQSVDDLLAFLTEEFAYCGCGYYEESIRVLRDVLQFASDRQRAMEEDSESFSTITRMVDAWSDESPGLATWFVWLLEKHDFIWHGNNVSDVWITSKGEAVLEAIKSHYRFSDSENGPDATPEPDGL